MLFKCNWVKLQTWFYDVCKSRITQAVNVIINSETGKMEMKKRLKLM
jgi:hypothetical protein